MKRLHVVLTIFILIFAAIICRLFYWTVIKSAALTAVASDQYYFKLTLSPIRGSIHARDGSPLVSNQTAYLVYAEPPKIEDSTNFAEKVAEILEDDKELIKERISVANIVWAPLRRKVNMTMYDKLKALTLPGLGFEKESMRYYPEASMAAHLQGFTGADENGFDKGYFGLEGFYDRALKGKPGSLVQEKDARGLPILLGTSRRIAAENGQNLTLFLDRSVQFIAEEKLKEALAKYGAKE